MLIHHRHEQVYGLIKGRRRIIEYILPVLRDEGNEVLFKIWWKTRRSGRCV